MLVLGIDGVTIMTGPHCTPASLLAEDGNRSHVLSGMNRIMTSRS